MTKSRIVLGFIICLSIAFSVGQTLSQNRRGYRTGIRPDLNRPRSGNYSGVSSSTRRQVTDETKEKSVKGAVGANDEQWKVIKPKLQKVKKLRRKACMVIHNAAGSSGSGTSQGRGGPQGQKHTTVQTGGGGASGGAFLNGEKFGGGSNKTTKDGISMWMKWKWAKGWNEKDEQRKDQKICYELFHLLHDKNADTEEIKQKIEALRKARQETKKELAEAQQQLRQVLTLDQQARLVALGWLD